MIHALKTVAAVLMAGTLSLAAAQTAAPAKTMSMPAKSMTMSMPAKSMTMSMPSKTMSMAGSMMKVNVNTASAADLMKIPGVSSTIAAAIIKNRPYKDSAELVKKVKGIGSKNVMKMTSMLSF